MNARGANLSTESRGYSGAYTLDDVSRIRKNGIKVFSTFSCGGGSSIGYKLAGCDVIAANDIDEKMASHYKRNSKINDFFLCPISDLVTKHELGKYRNIDILDGSPPCSTFSLSGGREKDWGKSRKFKEGQQEQVLSDLFYDYVNLIEKLQPKTFIAENVAGMIKGAARGYVKDIVSKMTQAGYNVQLFLLNSIDFGVPQKRSRLFFCGVRRDISSAKLVIKKSAPGDTVENALLGIVNSEDAIKKAMFRKDSKTLELWELTQRGENFVNASEMTNGKTSWFNVIRVNMRLSSPTVTAADVLCHGNEPRRFTFNEIKRLGAFPDDYQADSESVGKYIVGMSVPPLLTKAVASAVCAQWLGVSS